MTMLSMMQAVQQITTDAGLGFHDAVAGVAALALTGFWREMHSLKRGLLPMLPAGVSATPAGVVAAVERIVDAHPGSRVAVACHGGVVNAYLGHVLGLPAGPGFFYPNYTSIHRVAASSKGHRSILSVNESGHLRGTGLPVGLFHG